MPQAPAVRINDSLSVSGNGSPASGAGSIATRLLQSGFNVNALRPALPDDDNDLRAMAAGIRDNATLRIREWILYDTAVIDVARRRLVGVADLVAQGLTYPIADALGITRIEWEKIGTMTAAEVSMSGISQTMNDRQEYATDALPLPIIHKDFQINIRQLHSTRRMGTPLDVTQAQLSSRLVSEQIEAMLFNGATVLGTNLPIYGYTTAPSRVTGSVTVSWLTATGTQVVADILGMISAANTNNMYGPFALYVSQDIFTAFGADFKANGSDTVLTRVQKIAGIAFVKPTKDLTGTNVVLVQLTSDVVDMVDGMQPTTVQWETAGGMITNFKVMAIMVPRIKNDYISQSGIVHFS